MPAPLEADFLNILDTARMLPATLGQSLYEPVAMMKETAGASELFYVRSPNYDAEGEYTEERFVVLKANSKARKDITSSSVRASFVKRREALIAEGILKEDERFYVFQKDILFKTPSGTSALIKEARAKLNC